MRLCGSRATSVSGRHTHTSEYVYNLIALNSSRFQLVPNENEIELIFSDWLDIDDVQFVSIRIQTNFGLNTLHTKRELRLNTNVSRARRIGAPQCSISGHSPVNGIFDLPTIFPIHFNIRHVQSNVFRND